MTADELKDELDRICVDDLDDETKKELILHGDILHIGGLGSQSQSSQSTTHGSPMNSV